MANIFDLIVRITGQGQSFRDDVERDKAKLEEFGRKLDEVGAKSPNVRVDVDDAAAAGKLTELQARVRELDGQTIHIHVDFDDMSQKLKQMSGGNLLGSLIMAALPMASPLGAVGAAGAMGLLSALGAAGAGAAGLAAVAVPALGQVFDANKKVQQAQAQLDNAKTAKQRQAAIQKETEAWQGLDAAQQQELKSLIEFETFWENFTKQFSQPVANLWINGLKMLQSVLTAIQPVIMAAASAFTKLEQEAAKALNGPFWHQFFGFLGSNAQPMLVAFGEAIGNLIKGFAGLMMAFQPLSTSMAQGLLVLTQRFAAWATSLQSSQGFQQFIAYVRQNGPLVVQLIGQLASIAGRLLVAWAPVGSQILQAAVALATFVNRLLTANPWLGTLIGYAIAGAGAFRLFSAGLSPVVGMVGKLVEAVGAAPKVLGAFAAAGRLVGPVLSGIGQGLTILGGVVRVFATGFVAAIRAVTVAMMTNPIIAIITAIVAAVAIAAYEIITHWSQVRTFLVNTWNEIKSVAETVWNGLKSFLSSVWNGIVSGAHALANGVVAAFQWMYNHNYYFQDLVDFIRRAWTTIRTDTTAAWNTIRGALTSAWNTIRSTASSAFNAIQSVIQSAWNAVRSVTSSAWSAISSAISSAWSRVRSVIDAGAAAVRSVLTSAWNAVRSAATSAWNGIVSTISGAVGRIRSTLSSLASQAFAWGRNLVSEFVGGIRSMIGSVESAASSVAHAIARFLGFHSPTEAGPGKDADKWMPNLINMLAQGLYNGQGTIGRAANAAVDPISKAIQSAIQKSIGQVNQFAAATQSAMKRVAQANTWAASVVEAARQRVAAAHTRAARQIAEAHLRQAEAAAQAAKKVAEAQVQHDKAMSAMAKSTVMALQQEQTAWNHYLQQVQSAEETYQKNIKAVQDQLLKDEQEVLQKYEDQLKQTTQDIANFAGNIFSAVNHQQVSADDLINNLQDQVNTLKQYNQDIQTLAARGLSQGLLQQLEEMGPQMADQIHALATMTQDQLRQYVSLWQEQLKQAHDAAVKQLAPLAQDTAKQIQDLQNAAKQKMDQYYKDLQASLLKAAAGTSEQLTKIAQTAKEKGESAVASMADSIKAQLPGLESAAEQWGRNLIASIAKGMQSAAVQVQAAARQVAQQIANNLGFHSPTKEGPGAEADQWMPNLINMLVDGIRAGIPKVRAALGQVMVPPDVSVMVRQAGQQFGNTAASAVSQSVHAPVTININAPVYGVDDLQKAIKQGVEQYVVPVLRNQIRPLARAMGVSR